jgi:radical SAM protein with 4Fe4S-binding SPASM domain
VASSVPRLVDVDLNVTERCNLHCDFCSVSTQPVTGSCDELSLPEIERLLDNLDAMGVDIVRVCGGEPFVRRDIEGILGALGSHGFVSSVMTNATVMKRRHVEAVRAHGVDFLAFSVDGHQAALHDASRGQARSFERLLAMIACCKELDVRRRMMTALTTAALPHLPALVRFAERHGFELLNFIVLGLGGRANDAPSRFPTYAAWSRAIVGLTRFLAERRFKVLVTLLFPHEDPVPVELYAPLAAADLLHLMEPVWGIAPPAQPPQWGRSVCRAGNGTISILANGDVYGCDLMRGLPEWRAGNLRETPVRRIYHQSPLFRRWRGQPELCSGGPPQEGARDFSCAQCRAGSAHLGGAQPGVLALPRAAAERAIVIAAPARFRRASS